jgi:hypothetical protein
MRPGFLPNRVVRDPGPEKRRMHKAASFTDSSTIPGHVPTGPIKKKAS